MEEKDRRVAYIAAVRQSQADTPYEKQIVHRVPELDGQGNCRKQVQRR